MATTAARALSPGRFHELRIHGVAGSSPESMLGLAAEAESPGEVSVWRPPRERPELRAWSWSSLTSGRWYQAFYLLLLPFMIANLAGWMVTARSGPGGAPVRDAALRVSTLLVRLVGLLVTAVFAVSVQLVVCDLLAWQWLHRELGLPASTAGAGIAVTAAVFLGLVVLTRIRQRDEVPKRPWDDRHDPVGRAALIHRPDLLWNSPGINVALRRLHTTAGLATIAAVAAWPAGVGYGGSWEAARAAVFWTALGAAALAVGLLARISLGDGATGLSWVLPLVRHGTWPIAAAAVAGAAVLPFGLSPAAVDGWVVLPALRGAALWITVAVLAGVVLLAAVEAVAAAGRRALNAPGVLLVAASVGAAFGSGLAGQTSRLVGGSCDGPGGCPVVGVQVTWLAIGVTVGLGVFLTGGALRWAVLAAGRGGWRESANALTAGGSWATALLGTVGLLLGAAGVGLALGPGLPAPETIPAPLGALAVALVVGPLVGAATVVAWSAPAHARRRAGRPVDARTRALGGLAALAVVATAALAVVATTLGWSAPVLGIVLPPRTFVEFALDAAVVLPTLALLTRIRSGLADRDVRRGVGVLWDVGTFWPRWFHPLAPPTYSDRAVVGLAAQLDADLRPGDGRQMLLAPHSQGAVIAAAAVLAGPARPGLAMLSYGSPWEHLYAEFFPSQVNAAATAGVAARIDGGTGVRWRNLHRTTDPIGGRIDGIADTAPLDDPDRQGHSNYWSDERYATAAGELRGALDRPGARASGQTRWSTCPTAGSPSPRPSAR